MDLTDNAGVDVIYDGVGKAAFLKSPDCIRPMGMVISYGTASGMSELSIRNCCIASQSSRLGRR
jgi:NADPH:quinone reductase-like Zn-dependent oxidoreductase